MNQSEMEELVRALHQLVAVQQGAMAAQRVMLDSVVSALSGMPTFLAVVNETLTALEPHVRNDLEVESLEAFDNTIVHFNNCLDVMSRR
jgi:hypothetical protein